MLSKHNDKNENFWTHWRPKWLVKFCARRPTRGILSLGMQIPNIHNPMLVEQGFSVLPAIEFLL